jgi:hypothetical protein
LVSIAIHLSLAEPISMKREEQDESKRNIKELKIGSIKPV